MQKSGLNIRFQRFENSPVVQCWQIQGSNIDSVHTVMPSPYVQLIFPISGAIDISEIDKPVFQPFVSPVLSCFKKIKIKANSKIFGMHINPVAASVLYNGTPRELIRNANPIREALSRPYYYALQDIVMLGRNFHERVQNILRFYSSHASEREIGRKKIIDTILSYMHAQSEFRFSQISKETGYSQRWIQKLHKEVTGTSPTELMRIIRFNRFVNSLYGALHSDMVQLALQSGYYDQPHAIREFKKLGGFTPSKFVREQPAINKLLNYY